MAIRKRSNGRWIVDWRAHDPKKGRTARFWRSFGTKREAEDFERTEVGTRAARYTAPERVAGLAADISLAEYTERFLREAAATCAPQTVTNYRQHLATHILPTLGHMPVRDLAAPILRELFVSKALGTDARKRKLSPTSVASVLTPVRAMCRRAMEDGLLTKDPTAGLYRRLRLAKAMRDREVTRDKALTREQRDMFLATAERLTPELLSLWRTLFLAGLRIGEAAKLLWADMQLRGTRPHIFIRKEIAKTRRAREVPLSPALLDELRRLHARRAAEALRGGRSASTLDAERVFTLPNGSPLERSVVRYHFRRLCAKGGLPLHHTVHHARHTAATLLLLDGAPLRLVADMLGHSVKELAETYGCWLRADLGDWLGRLDAPATEPGGSKMVATAGGGDVTALNPSGSDASYISITQTNAIQAQTPAQKIEENPGDDGRHDS